MFLKPRSATAIHLALVGAVVAGLLLAAVLAASPQLHELLHHDDGEHSEHVCLVTTLHAGGFEDVLVIVMAGEPIVEIIATALPRELEKAESFFLSCRVLEHAPPRIA